MKHILITGGAGFVGSNLALLLKREKPSLNVFTLDNLKRRGSELNLTRLQGEEIPFHHGDIRNPEDLNQWKDIDLVIECSAEPSVLAGINEAPDYVINTNLTGTINCLNLALKHKSKFLFLSTSRVYPYPMINQIEFEEGSTRFDFKNVDFSTSGISKKGINESFPLNGPKTFYGATKRCSEILIEEYAEQYSLSTIINRCGVITGPWQMGKVDQGFVVLWVAHHFFKKDLQYLGFNGEGKQVRDVLSIEDLFQVINYQINHFDQCKSEIYNIGGGLDCNVSLLELTKICQEVTGNKIKIHKKSQNRPGDIPWYISDHTKFSNISKIKIKKDMVEIVENINRWIHQNENALKNVLAA